MTESTVQSNRVISIDVGLRHLALSVIAYNPVSAKIPSVDFWDVVDLSQYALSKNICTDDWVVSSSSRWTHAERCTYLRRCNIYAQGEAKSALESKQTLASHIRDLRRMMKQTDGVQTRCPLYFTSRTLIQYLDEFILHYGPQSLVVIENQPCMKNPTMKSIQMVLFTYFVIRGFDRVQFVNANKKIAYARACLGRHNIEDMHVRMESTSGKSLTKREAIASCTCILECLLGVVVDVSPMYSKRYFATRKKDDLSDCLLQGLYAIDREYGRIS